MSRVNVGVLMMGSLLFALNGCGNGNEIKSAVAPKGGSGGASGAAGSGGSHGGAAGNFGFGGISGAGGVSSGGGTGGATDVPGDCAETSANAEPTPVDMLLLVDTSGSMGDPTGKRGSATKWETVQKALVSFVGDPKSAGLGVGLQFFPFLDTDPMDITPNCDVANYKTPQVPIATLSPAQTMTLASAIQGRVTPAGNTPTNYALMGALPYLQTYQAANPGHRVILVLATDGLPNDCSDNAVDADPVQVNGIVSQIMTAASAMPPISTYVIGIFAPADMAVAGPVLQQFAVAGGTKMPYLLNTAPDLTTTFLAALATIRGQSLPCEFDIPPAKPGAMAIDFGKLNVRYQGSSGAQDVLYTGSAAQCDATLGGWYYDSDPLKQTPKKIIMCDATCRKFKSDTKATVELRFGCQTKMIK